jgi:hypothetical protein
VTNVSYEQFDLSDVNTYPLESRRSKAYVSDFARPAPGGVSAFLESLPNILAAAGLKSVIRAILEAKRTDGGILWGFGAHVIKTGLGPILNIPWIPTQLVWREPFTH